jgi:hypothetical protein
MAVKTQNAGRSETQRGGEQNLIANQIYSQSVIDAELVSWAGAGNNAVAATPAQGTNIQVLIWTSDYPCQFNPITYYGQSTTPALANSSWPDMISQTGNPADVATVFTADLATYDSRQRAYGTTVTAGIRVGGYMTIYTVISRGLDNGGLINAGGVLYKAICENGVVSGNPTDYLGGAGNPPAPAPTSQVILREVDYTQAILDADNTFTQLNGTISKVVGLSYHSGQ